MKKIDKFVFNLEWATQLEEMTLEEKGIVLENLVNYASGLPLNTNNRLVNSVWKGWQPDIDRMTNNYINSVKNGKNGGAPKGTIPWNKGKNKQTQSEPTTNPERTESEPDAKGEQTYKYNYNYNYKSEIELEVKDKVKTELEVKENIDNNSLDKVLPTSKTLSQNTNTGTNTHTREEDSSIPLYLQEPRGEVLDFLIQKGV